MSNILRGINGKIQSAASFSLPSLNATNSPCCMTLDILGRANGVNFKALKHQGSRQYCGCIETRDIGAYDSCPSGCKYCYANQSPAKAREMQKYHDPDSALLLGHLGETDVVRQSSQKSFLAPAQMELIELWE
ncbi:DUF1848 family protein [Bisgaard Taxon 10/6]|nr:DUF1848 family protein [Exercitatus varius]